MTRHIKSPHPLQAFNLQLNRKQFLRSLSAFAVTSLWSTSSFSQGSTSLDSEAYNRINRVIRDYDAQGDHRTGSPVDAQSGLWLSDRVDDAGIVPELEWMGVPTVQSHAAFLEVNGQRIDGVPLYDGGVTSPEGITGTFGTQGSSSDIGIAYAGPRIPSAFLDYRRTTEQKAIVAVTGGPENGVPEGLALMNAPSFVEPFGPPVLQVASQHREMLRQAAADGVMANFVLHVTKRPEEVFNVTATLLGTQPGLAPLIVMTPRSGWWTCASERGGGLSVWLEMIRAMAAGQAPIRTTVFVASTGHELGHYGLREFIRTRSRLLTSAIAWIHLGANFGAAVNGDPLLQASTTELQQLAVSELDAARARTPRQRDIGDQPAGEAHAVFEGGGDYISIIGSNGLFHHPHDRWPTAVDVSELVRYATAFTAVANRLANTT
jgi:hypothetical protein